MATDLGDRPRIADDWKVQVLAGLVLFGIGAVGLSNLLTLGLGQPVEWTTSTALTLLGLTVVMYGLTNIT